ncbi:MAG: hypothetical protein IJC21_08955 [Lentisphaeria bacterium]|nr:hypothetical protein [Lentisphaeria bacterium]
MENAKKMTKNKVKKSKKNQKNFSAVKNGSGKRKNFSPPWMTKKRRKPGRPKKPEASPTGAPHSHVMIGRENKKRIKYYIF